MYLSPFTISVQTITVTADGGTTDPPPCSPGYGPWTRTGNKQYKWYVTQTDTDSGTVTTVPEDGTITSSNTLTIDCGSPGAVSIVVALQEEWQDDNGHTEYWPNFQ